MRRLTRHCPKRQSSLLSPRRCSAFCVAVLCITAVVLVTSKHSLTEAELRYISIRVNNASRAEVNPHPFTYILNNPSVCADESSVFLIIYVHSAPGNFRRREIIRETWGNRKYYSNTMKIVFILGRTEGSIPELDAALLHENAAHKDIVQEDFSDTYRNLTYKAIAALKWVSTYCNDSKYVLKSDDDMIVNPFTLMYYLERKVNNEHIMCHLYGIERVNRDSERCKVTKNEYGIGFYPTYCSGSAFIMTTDIAMSLHDVSYSVPFFWVDDVYVTGLLPFKLGNVTYEQLSDKYEIFVEDNVVRKLAGYYWSSYIFGHVQDIDVFRTVWRIIVKYASQCRDDICLPSRGENI